MADRLGVMRRGRLLQIADDSSGVTELWLNKDLDNRVSKYQEMTEQANLWDCMLCGACSYVCPSNIPLSQMFGMAKYQLGRLRRKEDAA